MRKSLRLCCAAYNTYVLYKTKIIYVKKHILNNIFLYCGMIFPGMKYQIMHRNTIIP